MLLFYITVTFDYFLYYSLSAFKIKLNLLVAYNLY